MSCDASSRPLILVAHSLGGLVCKEAILQSRDNPEEHLQALFDSVSGIVFLGTPHKGSWMASWSHIPSKALGVVKSTNHSLLEILRESDQFLESVQDRFLAMIRQLQKKGRTLELTCFFEELPFFAMREIVSKDSATFPGYTAMSIHANHRYMVKYSSTDDNGFKRVAGELVRWEAALRLKSSLQLQASTSITITDDAGSSLDIEPHKKSEESPKELDDYYKACLTSLDFLEMGTRELRIAQPELNTCQWIYTDPGYMRWRSEANTMLWIKGNPGSGKSVLLKSLYARCVQAGDPSTILLRFFFNARGTEKERTVFGLYSALMHDLLRKDPSLMVEVLPVYIRKVRLRSTRAPLVTRDKLVNTQLGHLQSQTPQKPPVPTGLEEDVWNAAELADMFYAAIERSSASLIEIFIDALDECNEDEIREFISRVEHAIDRVAASGPKLRICWSSRYYPRISLRSKRSSEIAIGAHNDPDIEKYVIRELADFRSSLFEPLSQKILERARGVFLWVILVIKLLRKAIDRGRRDHEIIALLSKIPRELEDLFEEILASRPADPDDNRELMQLLQWTFCSQGDDVPLLGNLQQSFLVYVSMSLQSYATQNLSPSAPSATAFVATPGREVDRINDVSCGLINVSDASTMETDEQWKQPSAPGAGIDLLETYLGNESTSLEGEDVGRSMYTSMLNSALQHTAGNTAKIQVIHESVRDFFLASERSLRTLRVASSHVFIKQGHRDLATRCSAALINFDTSDLDPDWSPKLFKDEAVFLWRHRAEYLSRLQRNHFLIYAQRYGLTHFGQSYEFFNDSKPSSTLPVESVLARKKAIRNYLRLICLFELEEETMLYTAFRESHGRILRRHHHAFGIEFADVFSLWPAQTKGRDSLGFAYPPEWNAPKGMMAPASLGPY